MNEDTKKKHEQLKIAINLLQINIIQVIHSRHALGKLKFECNKIINYVLGRWQIVYNYQIKLLISIS